MPDSIVFFFIPGAAIVLLSIPLILRRIPPNPLYGLRVPATYKDEQVWYDANAAAGRDMAVFGMALTLLVIVLAVAGLRGNAFAITWTAALGAGAICTTILGWTRANRMLRERQTDAR